MPSVRVREFTALAPTSPASAPRQPTTGSNCRARACNHTFVADSALRSAMISVSRGSSLMIFSISLGMTRVGFSSPSFTYSFRGLRQRRKKSVRGDEGHVQKRSSLNPIDHLPSIYLLSL